MDTIDLISQLDAWLMQTGEAGDPGLAVDDAGRFILASTIGLVRSENQDRVVLAEFNPESNDRENFLLVALCDGMGGGVEGGRCAEIALSSIVSALVANKSGDLGTSMVDGVLAANSQIQEAYQNQGGTTFTGLLYTGADKVSGVHVGDSRAYRLARSAGTLEQLTIDDNLAALVTRDEGRSDDLEAYSHLANQLTQCLGMGDKIAPHTFEISAAESGTLLLSSDGLHHIGAGTMQDIMQDSQDLIETAERLIDKSRQLGGYDNASLALIESISGAQCDPGMLELHCPGISSLRFAESALQ